MSTCNGRTYYSCFMHAKVAHMRLSFFKMFSDFVHFCPNFQIFCLFCLFSEKITRMPFLSRIGPKWVLQLSLATFFIQLILDFFLLLTKIINCRTYWRKFFNWYSLHARLNGHYQAWSYKKKKHKKVKAYKKSV